ncbi:MAG TPA: sporulation protein YtxC [Tissierellaceae bacterium]|nr:sporulation protein YtxC [Tissierellaceae bacterium]
MEPINIGSVVPAEKLHDAMEKISLNKKVNISYKDFDDRYIYSFILNKGKTEDEIDLYNTLSEFVQETILKYYSKEFIRKKVLKLSKFNKMENERIIDKVYKIIINEKELIIEKDYMKKEILDYIMENNSIIIDGYLVFRSKYFNHIIERALDKVIKDIELEMEFHEFIYTLKDYVDNQEAQINGVNIIMNGDDFQIKDFDNIPINNDFIVFTLEELFDGDINQGDILLNTLLALMPSEIKIHIETGKENKLLNILKVIFEDRLTICNGCNLCYMDIIKNKMDKS